MDCVTFSLTFTNNKSSTIFKSVSACSHHSVPKPDPNIQKTRRSPKSEQKQVVCGAHYWKPSDHGCFCPSSVPADFTYRNFISLSQCRRSRLSFFLDHFSFAAYGVVFLLFKISNKKNTHENLLEHDRPRSILVDSLRACRDTLGPPLSILRLKLSPPLCLIQSFQHIHQSHQHYE